jgi:hypothetical protein
VTDRIVAAGLLAAGLAAGFRRRAGKRPAGGGARGLQGLAERARLLGGSLTHVARFFTKLGLRDRAQAVIYGYETGLVTPGGAA